MIFVTSWDDGHPSDLRIAELLHRYNLKGTFYIPIQNREGVDVMGKENIRLLDSGCEIGSHTYDHVYLNELSPDECHRQVKMGKTTLEDFLGHSVDGFCYPGGKHNPVIRKVVKDLKITHARTVNNFYLDAGKDNFQIPTTLQFYPHKASVFWKNYLKQNDFVNRFQVFEKLAFGADWLKVLQNMIQKYVNTETVIHIWGHSWEIEKHNLWKDLENFLATVASFHPKTKYVSELVEKDAYYAQR